MRGIFNSNPFITADRHIQPCDENRHLEHSQKIVNNSIKGLCQSHRLLNISIYYSTCVCSLYLHGQIAPTATSQLTIPSPQHIRSQHSESPQRAHRLRQKIYPYQTATNKLLQHLRQLRPSHLPHSRPNAYLYLNLPHSTTTWQTSTTHRVPTINAPHYSLPRYMQ